MKGIIKGVCCIFGGFIVNLLGGWDIWLSSLVFLMFVDIIVGLIKAFLCKSNKSVSGGLNSAWMFKGGLKKVLIFFLIALATVLDTIIAPENTYIRCSVTGYYIANEGLSIIENIGECGVPLPQIFYSILDVLKQKGDK